jgi:predicted dehydrogenase
MILGYQRGQSVAEGTWTQPAFPLRLPTMIYGETGAIAVTGADEFTISRIASSLEPTPPQTISAQALPEHYRSGPDYFTYCLLHDQPFEGIVSPRVALDSQEILEAGLRSMASGQRVDLPLRTRVER